MDEHKLKPKCSNKDNSRVTRPHVHGLINNIDVDNFTKSLEKSKYFIEYWQKGCICFTDGICSVWCRCTPDMVRARENAPATEREPLTCYFWKCYDDGAHATEIRYECGCYDR